MQQSSLLLSAWITFSSLACQTAQIQQEEATPIAVIDGMELAKNRLTPKQRARLHQAELARYRVLREIAAEHAIHQEMQRLKAQDPTVQTEQQARKTLFPIEVTQFEVSAFLKQRQGEKPWSLMSEKQAKAQAQSMVYGRKQAKEMALWAKKQENSGKIFITEPEPESPIFQVQSGLTLSLPAADQATVEVVEFIDFQCPYSKKMSSRLAQLRKEYGSQLKVSVRHFPLSQIHPQAISAAVASVCADRQNQFSAMHTALFAKQDAMRSGPVDFKKMAEDLGMRTAEFKSCMQSQGSLALIAQDHRDGTQLGIDGTPAIFINGKRVVGMASIESLRKKIDRELKLSHSLGSI